MVIIALVLLILLLVMPLGLAVTMGHCPDCPASAPSSPTLMCAWIVIAIGFGFAFNLTRLRATEDRALGLLLTRRLDRPPRLAR